MTTKEIQVYAKARVEEELKYQHIEIDEVGKILGVSIRWIQKHIDEIPHGEFNGKPRFFKGDIIKLLRR